MMVHYRIRDSTRRHDAAVVKGHQPVALATVTSCQTSLRVTLLAAERTAADHQHHQPMVHHHRTSTPHRTPSPDELTSTHAQNAGAGYHLRYRWRIAFISCSAIVFFIAAWPRDQRKQSAASLGSSIAAEHGEERISTSSQLPLLAPALQQRRVATISAQQPPTAASASASVRPVSRATAQVARVANGTRRMVSAAVQIAEVRGNQTKPIRPPTPEEVRGSALLEKHIGDVRAGCAARMPIELGNPDPPLNLGGHARALLQSPSVASAQARVVTRACNLTHLALLSSTCCTSQTLAWFAIAASPGLLGPPNSTLSCATAVAHTFGRRRVALVGDSIMQAIGSELVRELDSDPTGHFVRAEAPPVWSRPSPSNASSPPALPTLDNVCEQNQKTPCMIARYTCGLELVVIKAYDFLPATMSREAQAEAASKASPGKGYVGTRMMAALLGYADLLLIEPCAVHAHSMTSYEKRVSTSVELLAAGLRWAAAAMHPAAPRVRVALVEDVPQHFATPLGWFSRTARCDMQPHATNRFQSRAQLLPLTRFVEEGVNQRATSLLSSVLSPNVVRVSDWMAPVGVMAKCGGRHYNVMSGGGQCDCTHMCGSPLSYLPWFTGLHAALPQLLGPAARKVGEEDHTRPSASRLPA